MSKKNSANIKAKSMGPSVNLPENLTPFVSKLQFDIIRAWNEIKFKAANGQIIENRMLVSIDPKLLVFDMSYQRAKSGNIDTTKLDKNFNPDAYGSIIVNYRDGLFIVCDGCHRVAYAIKNGFKTITAEVRIDANGNGMSYQQEAAAFSKQNSGTVEMTQHHTFRGNVIAGDECDTIIDKLCSEMGILVTRSIGPREGGEPRLTGLKMARDIVASHGAEGLHWCIETIQTCGWLTQRNGLSSPALDGMRRAYAQAKGSKTKLDEYANLLKNSLLGTSFDTLSAELTYAWPLNRSDNRARIPLLIECIVAKTVMLDPNCNLPLGIQLSGYKNVPETMCPKYQRRSAKNKIVSIEKARITAKAAGIPS